MKRMLSCTALGLLFIAGAACGSDVSTTPDDGSGGGGEGGTGAGGTGAVGAGGSPVGGMGGEGNQGGAGAAPSSCDSGDDTVLMVDAMYYGETDWEGVPGADAWQNYGRDIDGLDTQGDLTGHCQPYAVETPLADGPGGLDNSFGKNVVPLIVPLARDISGAATSAIASGEFTYLLKFDDLAAGPDQSGLVTKFYGGTPLGAPAALDGSDCWSVAPEGLGDAMDVESSLVVFENGELAANQWSTAAGVDTTLAITVSGFTLELAMASSQMTLLLDESHDGGSMGVISGVIHVEDLIAQLQQLAGTFSPDLCDGPTFQALAENIRQAADIAADGTQDPGTTCDGISIGIGFTAVRAGIAGIGEPAIPTQNPCL